VDRGSLRALLAASLLVLAAAGAPALAVSVEDFEAGTFTDSKGLTLRYRLYVPRDYDAARRYPLVTFLHGHGQRGDDNVKHVSAGALLWAEPENQKRHPAFVLAPQSPANDGWGRPEGYRGYPASSPVNALLELLDDVERRFSIDPSRRYITGQSAGGHGSLLAMKTQPKRFAAAILVCPAGEPGRYPDIPPETEGVAVVAGIERIPLWFFHGTADEVVPADLTRQRVEALRRAGGTPRLTEYEGVKHDAWHRAYAEPELVEWLFAQHRVEGH
jgi:predicted peptidase